MIKFTKEQRENFVKGKYITCKYCGYNNEKHRFENFGYCLSCNKILDKRVYFVAKMMKELNREAVLQNNGHVL